MPELSRPTPRLRTAATCAALLLTVLLTACGADDSDTRGKGDAPVSGRAGEDTAAEVHNFPDGFGNLATKCVGEGKRSYVTTHSTQQTDDDETIVIPANEVIVDDPGCGAP